MNKKRKIAVFLVVVLAAAMFKSVGFTEEILEVEEIMTVSEESMIEEVEQSDTEMNFDMSEDTFIQSEELFDENAALENETESAIFIEEEIIVDISDAQSVDTGENDETDLQETHSVSGECGIHGANILWELDAEGILWIRGSGEMNNWSAPNRSPWSEYLDQISRIVVAEGVTSVGDYAFCGSSSIIDIQLADSVKSIGEYAFSSCIGLTEIKIG